MTLLANTIIIARFEYAFKVYQRHVTIIADVFLNIVRVLFSLIVF